MLKLKSYVLSELGIALLAMLIATFAVILVVRLLYKLTLYTITEEPQADAPELDP